MGKKGKKKDEKLCFTEGQIKTLLDEAREGDVCDAAADLIDEIDEKFKEPEEKKKKKPKTLKQRIGGFF